MVIKDTSKNVNNTKNITSFFEENIKKNRLRITNSRKIILEVLVENPDEFSAEELYQLVYRKSQKVGIATVYRTLELLEKIGLVNRVGFDGSKAIYKLREDLEVTQEKENISLAHNNINKNLSKLYKGGSGRNKNRLNRDVNNKVLNNKREVIDSNYPAGFLSENSYESYKETDRIGKIQIQMNKLMNDLNKVKKEKEAMLEDIMEDLKKVDDIINYHNYQKNDLIQILLDVQKEYYWLPKHVLFYIGNKLNVPLSNIYAIASFYKFFNLEPRGRHSILVCMGTACHIRGAMNLLQRVVNVLKVKPGDTTEDYRYTLDTVNCLGCCAMGPVMMIDNKYYSNPSATQLEKILNQYN